MESLKDLLNSRPTVDLQVKRPPTKLWLLAEQCANLTKTTPRRWLRACQDSFAVERAIIDFNEWQPDRPSPALCYLIKKYGKVS